MVSEQSRSLQMDERTSELRKVRDAAKERRSQLIKGDAKKKAVKKKKDNMD